MKSISMLTRLVPIPFTCVYEVNILRKIAYTLIAILILWFSGILLTISWIDRTAAQEFPGKYQLAAARIFWLLTPSVDREADANRAIKLSWLRTSTDINRKEKKEIKQILQILTEESTFLAGYLEAHAYSLSRPTQARAATYLLTYLNRVGLYENHSIPALESKIREFSGYVSASPPSVQEDWHREAMIRAYLQGDYPLYNDNRNHLLALLNQHKGEIPIDFVEGIISYYDGVLSCIGKRSDLASEPLSDAAKKLARYPSYTTNLLNHDLNVLLLGKGMESDSICKQALINVISSGV